MVPTYPHYWRKRSSVNPQALLPLMIVCFFFILHCDASRASSPSSVFYRNPNNDHNKNTMRRGHFLGFLPRHFPVPASGPSRKHNDIEYIRIEKDQPTLDREAERCAAKS
ncbi:hypothetical protein YC2023_039091 [Brassica napus]